MGANEKPRGMMMRLYMLATAVAGLCACATASEAPQRTAQQQREYDHLTAGRTPGKAEKCLPTYRSNDMTIIDDDTILFRDGRTTYVNNAAGRALSVGRPHAARDLADLVERIGNGVSPVPVGLAPRVVATAPDGAVPA